MSKPMYLPVLPEDEAVRAVEVVVEGERARLDLAVERGHEHPGVRAVCVRPCE